MPPEEEQSGVDQESAAAHSEGAAAQGAAAQPATCAPRLGTDAARNHLEVRYISRTSGVWPPLAAGRHVWLAATHATSCLGDSRLAFTFVHESVQ